MYDWTGYMNLQYPNWQQGAGMGANALGGGAGLNRWNQRQGNPYNPSATPDNPFVGTTYTAGTNPQSRWMQGAASLTNPAAPAQGGGGSSQGFVPTPEMMSSEWYGSYLPQMGASPYQPDMGVAEWMEWMKSANPTMYGALSKFYGGGNQLSSPAPVVQPVYGPGGENPATRPYDPYLSPQQYDPNGRPYDPYMGWKYGGPVVK